MPELRKVHDLVEAPADLGPGHPQDLAVQPDILPGGEFGMDARAHLDQGGHPPAHPKASIRGITDAGDELERGRFAGPVGPDDGKGLAFLDLEGDAVKSESAPGLGMLASKPGADTPDSLREFVSEGRIARSAPAVPLDYVLKTHRIGHG